MKSEKFQHDAFLLHLNKKLRYEIHHRNHTFIFERTVESKSNYSNYTLTALYNSNNNNII